MLEKLVVRCVIVDAILIGMVHLAEVLVIIVLLVDQIVLVLAVYSKNERVIFLL